MIKKTAAIMVIASTTTANAIQDLIANTIQKIAQVSKLLIMNSENSLHLHGLPYYFLEYKCSHENICSGNGGCKDNSWCLCKPGWSSKEDCSGSLIFSFFKIFSCLYPRNNTQWTMILSFLLAKKRSQKMKFLTQK